MHYTAAVVVEPAPPTQGNGINKHTQFEGTKLWPTYWNPQNPFFTSLPTVAIHDKPLTPTLKGVGSTGLDGLEYALLPNNVCPCASICHEWPISLMHRGTNMHDFIGRIFRDSMDNYWLDRQDSVREATREKYV
tara:strand:- start:38 stop:439 length:402 start_codon:yes stop_codon:yes gene_type:complete